MRAFLHKLLYRLLSLENYLRFVSSLLFMSLRLGLGRRSKALEYIYHLPKLTKQGDTVLDIGANLGYYTCSFSKIVGESGRVIGVEPVPLIFKILQYNTRGCKNVELHNVALGTEEKVITMANATVSESGYFGTGQNFVREDEAKCDVEFEARMLQGSKLFANLERLDLIKCDIEGYETVVMPELKSLILRHKPIVLIESGGDKRSQIFEFFTHLGYRAFTLFEGEELPLSKSSANGKDIIFRPCE